MSDFTKALSHTLKFEGGYANSKADRGGETFRGISRVSWPGWAGWPAIDAIKTGLSWKEIDKRFADEGRISAMVSEFYFLNFWRPFVSLGAPAEVNCKLFDMAVNVGLKQAIKYFQRSLNALGAKLVVDGAIGPQTILAAQGFFKQGQAKYVVNGLIVSQKQHYENWLAKNPAFKNARASFMDRANYDGWPK